MKHRYLIMFLIGVIGVVVGGSIFGYSMYTKSDLSGDFVSTGNAQVVVDVVQVGSIHAGRIVVMNVDVGTPVVEGQVIATVGIPAVISRSDITDTTKIGFRAVQDQLAEVVAPRSGVISARWSKEGDVVSAGQRIVTLMDLRQVWVEANIVEDKIEKVRPGQYVEVDIDSLGRKVAGRVETVSPATVSASSLVQERSSSANASRGPGPVVPVKIALDEDRLMLIPGSSAEIKIWVR